MGLPRYTAARGLMECYVSRVGNSGLMGWDPCRVKIPGSGKSEAFMVVLFNLESFLTLVKSQWR